MNSQSICWYSTPENRAENKVSVLAVTETILSVAAYWWIAVAFDTYIHLVTSILIAPLVLLRSEASVSLGVAMYARWQSGGTKSPKISILSLIFLLAGSFSGLVVWPLAESWLATHTGWPMFWRAAVLGLLAGNIGIAISVAVAGIGTGTVVVLGVVVGVVAGVLAMALAGTTAAAIVGIVAAAVVGAVAVVAAVKPGAVPAAMAGLGLGTGLGSGIFFRASFIRFWATLKHFLVGVRAFPKNWRDLTTRTDAIQPPEILPGLPRGHPFHLENYFAESKNGPTLFVTLIIMLPILYLPSLIYRYSLKSTAWLYLPLIYIAYLPAKLRDAEGRQIWVQYVGRTILDRIVFGFSFVVLAVAVIAVTDWVAWTSLVGAGAELSVPVPVLSIFLVLDWSAFQPWHWFSLPAAILTIGLFFWLDILRKREAAGEVLDYEHWTMRGTLVVNRLRNGLAACWIAFALYGFIALAYTGCKLPLWSTMFLSWRFGSVACT